MSSHTRSTMRETAAAKWATGLAGYPIRASMAQAAARAGIVEQQAMFCAEQARGAAPDTALLDWEGRNDLAQRWAAMPGLAAVDPEVIYACSGKLST
jgi:hypothetical protein